jgi:hypothetical protein
MLSRSENHRPLAPAPRALPYFTRSVATSTNGATETVQPIGLVAYTDHEGIGRLNG